LLICCVLHFAMGVGDAGQLVLERCLVDFASLKHGARCLLCFAACHSLISIHSVDHRPPGSAHPRRASSFAAGLLERLARQLAAPPCFLVDELVVLKHAEVVVVRLKCLVKLWCCGDQPGVGIGYRSRVS